MKAFLHHLAFEFRSGLRDKSHLLMNYLFPMVFFGLMGGLMSGINPGFRQTLIPAMTLFALMCGNLLSLPSALVASRESGLFRAYRINGVPSWAALAVPPLANLVHMALVTAMITVLGHLLFSAPLPADWAWFCLAWLGVELSLAGLGVLIATLASSSRSVVLVSQLVYIPSIILGGLMMPASILPAGLAKLSRALPATHGMGAFAGGANGGSSLAILAAGALLSFGASLLVYEWDPRNGRPAGRKLLGLLALAPYALAMAL
jgi:ABC-2 type transport system permease protein